MTKKYYPQLGVIALIITVSCAYLISLATPIENATRVRNALVHQPGQLGDFTWGPSSFPDDFRVEVQTPPQYFQQFVNSLPINPDMPEMDKFLLAAEAILDRERHGGPIQSNTVDTLKKMQTEGIGWCSDYTQVFNGIAHALNIPVREWGMSFNFYNGNGHAFNEIYDSKLGKWIFIDTFNAFYVTDQNNEPLSVLEFHQFLNSSPDQLIIQKIDKDRFGFKDAATAIDYYQRGMPQLFMIWANDVFSYDAHPLIQLTGSLSRMAEQITGILLGINQEIRLYPDPSSTQQQKELLSLKQQVIFIIVLNTVLGILFLLLLFRKPKHRNSHG